MSKVEAAVAQHYTTGELTERIRQALKANGIDPDTATAQDLKAGDEFHTGGIAATEHLFGQLQITPDTRVLDVGSGIGGTSRYIADAYGAHVTGIDLTQEFVDTASALSAITGLADKTIFHQGSALAMPVPDEGFDLAVLMHVGMNIADKAALFAEVARCLAPGGTFAVFEVMRGPNTEPMLFPQPWATVADTSFVHAPEVYKSAAKAAGLTLQAETDRTDFAKAFFEKVFAVTAAEGPNPLGIHLMMGETAPVKFENYVTNLHAGKIQPTEMIFAKDAA